jgi:hypothetical protein
MVNAVRMPLVCPHEKHQRLAIRAVAFVGRFLRDRVPVYVGALRTACATFSARILIAGRYLALLRNETPPTAPLCVECDTPLPPIVDGRFVYFVLAPRRFN